MPLVNIQGCTTKFWLFAAQPQSRFGLKVPEISVSIIDSCSPIQSSLLKQCPSFPCCPHLYDVTLCSRAWNPSAKQQQKYVPAGPPRTSRTSTPGSLFMALDLFHGPYFSLPLACSTYWLVNAFFLALPSGSRQSCALGVALSSSHHIFFNKHLGPTDQVSLMYPSQDTCVEDLRFINRVASWRWVPEFSTLLFSLRSGHPDLFFPKIVV